MSDGRQRSRVRLSFTSLSLGYPEFSVVCDSFATTRSWKDTLDQVRQDNLLQRPSAKTAQRIFGEIRKRIETLSEDTISAFPDANPDDRRFIAYLACCKLYPIIFDFVRHVLLEKAAVFDHSVGERDFEAFWNRAAVDHEDLETVSAKTREKARQNTFKMLLEAGILSNRSAPTITSTPLSPLLRSLIEKEGAEYRHAFLVQ